MGAGQRRDVFNGAQGFRAYAETRLELPFKQGRKATRPVAEVASKIMGDAVFDGAMEVGINHFENQPVERQRRFSQTDRRTAERNA